MQKRGIPKLRVTKKNEDYYDDEGKQNNIGEQEMITLPVKQKTNVRSRNQKIVKNDGDVVGGKIKNLLEKVQTLEKEKLLLEKENNTLNTKIQRLEGVNSKQIEEKEEIENLIRELSRKAEITDNLQKQNNALQGELNYMNGRAKAAEANLAEKETLLEDIQNSTESRKFEFQHLLQEREILKQSIQDKEALIQQYEHENQELKENCEKLSSEIHDLSSQVILSESENDSIVKKLNDKTKESENLKNELEEANNKISKISQDLESAQNLIASLKKENEEASMNLQSNYAAQMDENCKLKSSLREKDIVINDQKRQISLMSKNIKEIQDNIAELTDEKESITQKMNNLNQQLQDSLGTIKSQEKKIELLNQTIQDKDSEKNNLRIHFDKLQHAMENQNGEKESSLLSTIETQQNEISNQCKEIEILKSKLTDANSLNVNLQEKIRSMNQNNNSLQDKIDSYTSQIESLKLAIHQLEDKLNAKQSENDKLNSEITTLLQEVSTGNDQIAALTTENQNLQEQINQLSVCADQMNGANDKLRLETQEHQKIISRCNELERLNALLHDQIEKSNLENAEFQKEIKDKNKKISILQSKKSCEDSEMKVQYVQRIIELEEELKIYRQSPALAITEYKMKSYEDQINRLNIKIQSIQAETEKRDLRKLSHHPSGEKFIIQSQKAKIQEQERQIEMLKFENKALTNCQMIQNQWKEKFEELVKKDTQSREELKKSILQLKFRFAQSGLESDMNSSNQVVC